jgi:hypothetical protein
MGSTPHPSAALPAGADRWIAPAGRARPAQGGDLTSPQIQQLFGKHAAAIVKACSDTDETPNPPWRARKERYIAHIRDPQLPKGTLRVSLADKLHNARAILFDLNAGNNVFARFNAGRGGRDRPCFVEAGARITRCDVVEPGIQP